MPKVRITALGKNAKQLNWPVHPGMGAAPDVEVNKTLKPVPREDANLEAEKGETAVADMTGSGIPQQYNIAGKPHSQGGTPLDLPGKSFIFSKDNDMKIKDEKIQKMFGMSPSKSGYTPAEIAKKYDLNKYHKILGDDNTDDLQKETAEMMIGQYNMKLAKLALVQESLKGFPQGIPAIAEPYVTAGIINPEELAMTQSMPEIPGATEMRYGGPVKKKVRIISLPKAENGVNIPSNEDLAKKLSEFNKAKQAADLKAKQQKEKEANSPGLWDTWTNFVKQNVVRPMIEFQYNPDEDKVKLNTLLDEFKAKGSDPNRTVGQPYQGVPYKDAPLKTYAELIQQLNNTVNQKQKEYDMAMKIYGLKTEAVGGKKLSTVQKFKESKSVQPFKTAKPGFITEAEYRNFAKTLDSKQMDELDNMMDNGTLKAM